MSKPIYFQFPLSCLAWGGSPRERMEAIMNYCQMERGHRECTLNPQGAASISIPKGSKVTPGSYRAWSLGGPALGVRGGDAKVDWRNHQRLSTLAPHPFVRIRNDWFWNCLHGLRGTQAERPLSYVEFSVLCAILSKVGTKKHSSCTWREVQCRAMGYTTQVKMAEGMRSRVDGAKPMSRQQIRTVLERLETNQFFARFVVYAGKAAVRSHYSFSMRRSKLAVEVAAKFGQRRRLLIPNRRRIDRDISLAHAMMLKKN